MSLLTELRRRNVFRVGAAYGVVAWLLIQVAATLDLRSRSLQDRFDVLVWLSRMAAGPDRRISQWTTTEVLRTVGIAAYSRSQSEVP